MDSGVIEGSHSAALFSDSAGKRTLAEFAKAIAPLPALQLIRGFEVSGTLIQVLAANAQPNGIGNAEVTWP
jgi:hypothetical protein